MADDLPEAVDHAIVRVGAGALAGLKLAVIWSVSPTSREDRTVLNIHSGFCRMDSGLAKLGLGSATGKRESRVTERTDDIQRVHDKNLVVAPGQCPSRRAVGTPGQAVGSGLRATHLRNAGNRTVHNVG